jgi:hypothetical protein
MEPSGRNWSQSVANGTSAKRLGQAQTVAVGCDRLPERGSMVRRGSTVRVRQRAYLKVLQIGTCCCLRRERTDTFPTHIWYARRNGDV